MKKHLTMWRRHVQLPFLLILPLLLSACEDTDCIRGEGAVETRTLSLDPFTRVAANGDFKVYITQGVIQTVEVKGEPNILDQLRTSVSNGTWKIENRECIRRSEPVEVYITMPLVQSLYLNGSGRIIGQNAIDTDELDVEVNGSGKIELNVTAEQVRSRITGSGEAVLAGEAIRHNVNISGSGRVEAFDLLAENVTVNLSGSGVAEVSAASTLTVEISGSGNVYYKGDPTINSNVSGSGKLIKR